MSDGRPTLDDHSPLLEASWCQEGLPWSTAMESRDVGIKDSSCGDTSPTGSDRIARTPAEKKNRKMYHFFLLNVIFPFFKLKSKKVHLSRQKLTSTVLKRDAKPCLPSCCSA